jgi:predicted alpha/beta hydrolase family esterase
MLLFLNINESDRPSLAQCVVAVARSFKVQKRQAVIILHSLPHSLVCCFFLHERQILWPTVALWCQFHLIDEVR